MKLLVVKSKEYKSWSTPCSSGKDDDKITYWMSVQFKKGDEPEHDKCIIEDVDCFMSCYETKSGETKPKMVIMDYTYAPDEPKKKKHTK